MEVEFLVLAGMSREQAQETLVNVHRLFIQTNRPHKFRLSLANSPNTPFCQAPFRLPISIPQLAGRVRGEPHQRPNMK